MVWRGGAAGRCLRRIGLRGSGRNPGWDQMGVRWYDAALGRWLSADVIVPGMGVRSGCGMATLGCDEQQRLGPLTVGFYNEQFISVVGEENREVLARGFWFQRSEAEQAQSKYQWGPQNPQGLNRFTYVLNNLEISTQLGKESLYSRRRNTTHSH
jgi:hypothetical protein